MNVILEIHDIAAGGDGVARMADGRTVFVPYAAPGDRVQARIKTDKEGVSRATDVTWMSSYATDHRASPPCPHFTRCGGCALQHLSPETYRSYKWKWVQEQMVRHGLVLPERTGEIFLPYATRRRANFAVRVSNERGMIGFHERKSANLRDVPDCLLITEDVRKAMEAVRPFLPALVPRGTKLDLFIQCADGQVELGLTGALPKGWEAQQALSDMLRAAGACRVSHRMRDYEPYAPLLVDRPFFKRFGSLMVPLAPCAFLQPSAEGEAALTRLVLDGIGDARRVADLFCGNGTFSGPLSQHGRVVLGFDNAKDSITLLHETGMDAKARDLFKNPLSPEDLDGFEAVVLDPPRAGALEQAKHLAQSNVPTVVYVSCNPSSFARDCAILGEGGYGMDKLTLLDQFIWSPHTEIYCVMKKL